jgi:hypothetical protein
MTECTREHTHTLTLHWTDEQTDESHNPIIDYKQEENGKRKYSCLEGTKEGRSISREDQSTETKTGFSYIYMNLDQF